MKKKNSGLDNKMTTNFSHSFYGIGAIYSGEKNSHKIASFIPL
jgi:hypothetical protein